ncbi:hypothetical protein [Nocardia transvalensis]|uniref:hypothetical protein n=1 Tax=Nocardia transvalensis TaxID=37333 RepID=UPI001894C98A|nr:hypothetical protein [Nocardia transvalensis]MBF6328428.1 hypothetical protein [Nocardia transvalensis]
MIAVVTTTPGDDPGERPEDANSSNSDSPMPEWAPVEPLPSSEMFLAAFAGRTPVAATDILDPAAELVQCLRQYRLAFEALSHTSTSTDQIKQAAAELVSAHADIEMLILVIDDAVADRLLRRHKRRQLNTPSTLRDQGVPEVAVHTQSIGEIAARMADLWETVSAKAMDPEELPEAHQLCELCAAYDGLAAEIEAGQRIPPGL